MQRLVTEKLSRRISAGDTYLAAKSVVSRPSRSAYIAALFLYGVGIMTAVVFFGIQRGEGSTIGYMLSGYDLRTSVMVSVGMLLMCAGSIVLCALWLPGAIVLVPIVLTKGFIACYALFLLQTIELTHTHYAIMLGGNILAELVFSVGFVSACANAFFSWKRRAVNFVRRINNNSFDFACLRPFLTGCAFMVCGTFLKGVVLPLILRVVG